MHTDPNGHFVLALLFLLFSVGMVFLSALAFIRALNGAIENPSASNIFAAIVAGIFLALSIFSLVSSIKGFLQALKPVSTMTTTKAITQGADDTVAAFAKTDQVTLTTAKQADFTDDAWREIQGLQRGANGTRSSTVAGTKIHKGFGVGQRGKVIGGGPNGGYGFFDKYDEVAKIIYELKPNNFNSIMKGIEQLHRYNDALGKGYKLILVLY